MELFIPGKLYEIKPGSLVTCYKSASFGGVSKTSSGFRTFHPSQGPLFYLGESNTSGWFQFYFLVGSGEIFYLPIPRALTEKQITEYWTSRLLF